MSFTPRLDVLPTPQRLLWPELSAIPPEFVLYGGTAIALHLSHRQSVDFDFFGEKNLEPTLLFSSLPLLADAIVTQAAPNTLSCEIQREGAIKLSFFGLPQLPRLMPPHISIDNGLKVASLADLAATKMAVVQQRIEVKDYLDIDAILSDGRISLSAALSAASLLYKNQFNPLGTLKALAWFDDPHLEKLPAALKTRLVKAVSGVDLTQFGRRSPP